MVAHPGQGARVTPLQAPLPALSRQGGPWGAACHFGVPVAPVTPPPAPQTLLAVPLCQGKVCLGGEAGGSGVREVPDPGMAAALTCPCWLSFPAGVTGTHAHPHGVTAVTGCRPGCLGPTPTPVPPPTHHGAVESYWEALGSWRGASVPHGGRATGWGLLGGGGGASARGSREWGTGRPMLGGVAPWPPLSRRHGGGVAVGASCPPAAAGGRHVAAGTFLPPWCRLSLVCGGNAPISPPPPTPAPPPTSSPKQLLQIPPLAHCHIWATSGRRGRGGGRGGLACPVARGLLGGRMLLEGGTRGPESARGRGMKEVVARVTAPEPGRLPRAAGSCAGWRRHGGAGGTGGCGVPQPPRSCAHPALYWGLGWGTCPWAAGEAHWDGDPPKLVTRVTCTLRGNGPAWPLAGDFGKDTTWWPHRRGHSSLEQLAPIHPLQGGTGVMPMPPRMVPTVLLGWCPASYLDGAHKPASKVPATLLGWYL